MFGLSEKYFKVPIKEFNCKLSPNNKKKISAKKQKL